MTAAAITTAMLALCVAGKPCVIGAFHQHWNGRRWVLDADLLWWDGHRLMVVPRGFQWNGASVPSPLQWYEGPGDHLVASCIHDWIYQYHRIMVYNQQTGTWEWFAAGKRFGDKQWWKALDHVYHVRHTKIFVLWDAVHIAGWPAYLCGHCNNQCAECPVYKQRAIEMCSVFITMPVKNKGELK